MDPSATARPTQQSPSPCPGENSPRPRNASQPTQDLPAHLNTHIPSAVEPRKTRRARPAISTRQALMNTLSSSEPCDLFAHDPPSPSTQQMNQTASKSRTPTPSKADSSRSMTPSSGRPSPPTEVTASASLAGNPEPQPTKICLPGDDIDEALAAGHHDVTIKHHSRRLVVRDTD